MPSNTESPECNCGPLTPQSGEKPIKDGTTADQLISKVQLLCDDETGVFFFRYNQKLYMRTVSTAED